MFHRYRIGAVITFVQQPEVWPDRIPSRVFLRPIGTPLPLGFLGLTVATVVLAAVNLSWVPASEQHQAAIVLIAFAFPLQAIATVFGFLGRDAVVSSGVGVQAGGWLTIGLLLLLSPPGSHSKVLAIFLFAAAGALLSSVVVAAASKVMPALVLAGTATRFTLTGIYELTDRTMWAHVAGWEGLALGALAVYTAIALDIEGVDHKTILPVLRHGKGRQAIDGGPRQQLDRVVNEPGVRSQL
jgi:succinate-acetate transporter protein